MIEVWKTKLEHNDWQTTKKTIVPSGFTRRRLLRTEIWLFHDSTVNMLKEVSPFKQIHEIAPLGTIDASEN